MSADTHLLAQLVAFSGLVAAVGEYAHIIRRRADRRRAAAEASAAQSGLQGLVRVLLTDPN